VDKDYIGAPANGVMCDRNYMPYVPVAEEERTIVLNDPSHRPRRWIVEAFLVQEVLRAAGWYY